MNVTGGATDVTTYFVLRLAADGTEATGLTITNFDLQYVRTGSAPVAKVDATALAATDSAHADNKAIEIDATDQPGLYRVDWPDAAFAAGAKQVILTVKCATCFTEHLAVNIDAPVNLTSIAADQQSATDLKDFADTGYDPSAHVATVKLGDIAHGGTAAVLTFSRLIGASATTNEPAMKLTGNGSAAAIMMTGGATGPGAAFVGGSSSGAAASFTNTTGNVVTATAAAGNGSAVVLTGQGSGHGLSLVAGATGNGFRIASTSGSGINVVVATDGDAATLTAGGSARHGLKLQGGNSSGSGLFIQGTGASAGALIQANSGHALSLSGGGSSGNGLRIQGGTAADAINITGGSTSGNGISISTTSGDGISVLPTAGHALVLTGNGTSKHGVSLTGGTAGTSHGVSITAGSGGKGVNLDTLTATGAMTVDSLAITNALTTGSITNSGTTSLAAVTTSGTVTLNALTVSNALTVGSLTNNGTTTLTGAVGAGAVTLSSLTVTNATTLTGAVTATNASNDFRGVSLSVAGLQAFATTNVGLSTTDIDPGSVVHLIIDNVSSGSAPTAGEIAEAVWTETLADHSGVSGSTAEALNAAGAAGDPWITALPGGYSAGQAGFILGTNLNATVSSRSSHAAADVWGVGTRVLTAGTNIALTKGTGLLGLNDIAATAIVSGGAITTSGGAVSTVANVTNLHASAALETTSQLIKNKTDALPNDPADASDIATAFSTVSSALSTISAKTANLPNDPADQSAVETAIATAQTALTALLNAVKTKTDSMTFTVAGYQDVNVRYVNNTELTGAGVPVTNPWRPV